MPWLHMASETGPSSSKDTTPSSSAAQKTTSNLTCGMCTQEFVNAQEWTEHFWSLTHHVKQARADPSSSHTCSLCKKTYDTLAGYSDHLDSETHEQKLDAFRRPTPKINTAPQPSQYRQNYPNFNSSRGDRDYRRDFCNQPQPPRYRPAYYETPYQRPYADYGCYSSAVYQQDGYHRASSGDRMNFAEDSFSDYFNSFQNPYPTRKSPNFFNEMPNRYFYPRPPPNQNNSVKSSKNESESYRRPAQPRVVIQSEVSSLEPEEPMDVRHLAQSDRFAPTTLFVQRRQRVEYRRKLGEQKSHQKISKMSKKDEKSKDDGAKNSQEKSKDVQKTTSEADSTTENVQAEEPVAVPDKTGTVSTSISNRISSTNLRKFTASHMASRRIIMKSQSRLSDKLLAERLQRYRLVLPSQVASTSATNTPGETLHLIPASSQAKVTSGGSNETSKSAVPAAVETVTLTDAEEQPLSNGALLKEIPSKDKNGQGTNGQKSVFPKQEMPEEESVKSKSNAATSITHNQIVSPPVTPMQTVPMITPAKSRNGSSGQKSPRILSPTSGQAHVEPLRELWHVVKREEAIRTEYTGLEKEMNRLKQEMHRVWYRQRELEQDAKQCQERKQTLLDMCDQRPTDCDGATQANKTPESTSAVSPSVNGAPVQVKYLGQLDPNNPLFLRLSEMFGGGKQQNRN